MFNKLPKGVKISINRSIKVAFERYMEKIKWNEQNYKFDEFFAYWRAYSNENASWVKAIDQELWSDQAFQEGLMTKMNEVIKNIITSEPTLDQMERITILMKELGLKDIDYCCSLEADYHIRVLEAFAHSSKGKGKYIH